jgi:hypothetical protein
MKIENLISKKVILFTKRNFRFQGTINDVDAKFIEIFDDIKKKSKIIAIEEIAEIELVDG